MPVKTKKPTVKKTNKTKKKSQSKLLTFLTKPSRARILVFVLAFGIIGVGTALLSQAATGDGSVPVYRAFSSVWGSHMFTQNGHEANETPNFNYEGVAFYAWNNANNGRQPVYRLNANNHHFFTISAAEKDAVVKNGGKLEGIAWYAYLNKAPGRIPVYRLGGTNGNHVYTTSEGEKNSLDARPDTAYEGIPFYVSDRATPKDYNAPVGAVDGAAGCQGINGWAVDKDLPEGGVPINVYIDGKGYDLGFTSKPRADVNRAAGVSGSHGFEMNVPQSWRDAKAHTWVAYAINIDSAHNVIGQNKNVELKRGEFACYLSGQDIMPQILAQRAEAERQRLAAIAAAEAAARAAEAAQAQAEQNQRIIDYAVAIDNAKKNDELARYLNAVAQNNRNQQAAQAQAAQNEALANFLNGIAQNNREQAAQAQRAREEGDRSNYGPCIGWNMNPDGSWNSYDHGLMYRGQCRSYANYSTHMEFGWFNKENLVYGQ